MKLDHHYFTLYSAWGPKNKNVFISDIAEKLSCSDRHAKSIVKQMKESQWIDWEPSPGRGKASKLTFLLKPKEVEEHNVRSWIEQGDIAKALKWMENQTELETSFVTWLEGQFQWTPSHQRDDGLDVLSYPYYRPIHTLVPCDMTTRHEGHIGEHIFNRLLHYSYEDKKFLPELAHYWESRENGRIWRFYLRKGLLFHDGNSLTSKTIMENIIFWKKEHSNGWKLTVLDEVEKIETPSTTMIDIYLTRPNKLFLHLFTNHKSMIIPVQLYNKNREAFRWHPVGSGPYQITDHRHGHMILEAFPYYFGFRPLLDKVELYNIPNSPLPPARQVYYHIVDQHSSKIKKIDWFRPEIGGVYLVVNDRKEGMHRHPEFRKMLSYAIDRSKLFQNHPHHEVWFPDSFFDEHAGVLRQQTNTDLAREWFETNGFRGQTITLTSTCLEHNAYFDFELEQLKTVFSDLGITLHTKVVDIHELSKEDQLQQTDIIIAGTALGENRLVSMLNALTSKSSFICNTLPSEVKVHLESLLDTVRQSPDTQDAYENLRNIETFLLDNYYLIFLYQRKVHIHVEADERFQGIEINRYNRLNYHKLWYRS